MLHLTNTAWDNHNQNWQQSTGRDMANTWKHTHLRRRHDPWLTTTQVLNSSSCYCSRPLPEAAIAALQKDYHQLPPPWNGCWHRYIFKHTYLLTVKRYRSTDILYDVSIKTHTHGWILLFTIHHISPRRTMTTWWHNMSYHTGSSNPVDTGH